MGEISAFQVAMIMVSALFALINLFIGIMINHMLQEQRGQREIMREIETQYFPRREFERYEEQQTLSRHKQGERITALEIRAGDWKAT